MLVTRRGADPLEIVEFSRAEFLAHYWQYRPGQHVTILAPTDYGKTTFVGQLLAHTIRPELPVLRFALKPKDVVMSREVDQLGLKVVKAWPPMVLGRPNGWVLWPPLTDDYELDDQRIAPVVLDALRWAYRNASKGKRSGLIVDVDEMEEIQRLLATIDRFDELAFLRGLYRRMRSNGGGMFTGCQAPRWLVTDAYSQAAHLFLGNDPDERNRARFGEIGGVDPRIVENAVVQLPDRCWLYLRRRGRVMCIVGP